MRGILSYEKWYVWESLFGHSYSASRTTDGKSQHVDLNSHCLACAKIDVLAKYGGQVDLRGWHLQGVCGGYLKAMASVVAKETKDGQQL